MQDRTPSSSYPCTLATPLSLLAALATAAVIVAGYAGAVSLALHYHIILP